MVDFSAIQGGQSDLERAATQAAVLLKPYSPSLTPITTLGASGTGDLDTAKLTGFTTVGNWTKSNGVSLTNNPTINDVESHGYGSPTRQIAAKAAKGINFEAQENVKYINLQNQWGFTDDAVTIAAAGDVVIRIPELPADILWQAILITKDVYLGQPLYRYWVSNKANIGARADQKQTDGDVDTLNTALNFQNHPALPGVPIVFGICGPGWLLMNAANNTGFKKTTQYTVSLGAASAGTFTLSYGGVGPTATIAYNAANSAVKTALVNLDDGFVAADWTVTGTAPTFTVTVPTSSKVLTGDGSGLTGGTFAVTPL